MRGLFVNPKVTEYRRIQFSVNSIEAAVKCKVFLFRSVLANMQVVLVGV